GFEPPKRGLDAYTLSRRAPSTTRTPLRWIPACRVAAAYRAGHSTGSPGRRQGNRSGLLRVQPAGVASGVALVLPDRHSRLDLVDDPAAGGERGLAVGGAGAGPDRQVADGEVADPVHAGGVEDVEAGPCLGQDRPALAF